MGALVGTARTKKGTKLLRACAETDKKWLEFEKHGKDKCRGSWLSEQVATASHTLRAHTLVLVVPAAWSAVDEDWCEVIDALSSTMVYNENDLGPASNVLQRLA
eukprot:jgi/Chrzof1/4542/Cz14g17180.t1